MVSSSYWDLLSDDIRALIWSFDATFHWDVHQKIVNELEIKLTHVEQLYDRRFTIRNYLTPWPIIPRYFDPHTGKMCGHYIQFYLFGHRQDPI